MKRYLLPIFIVAFMGFSAGSHAAETQAQSDCEKNGFKQCVFGLNWGKVEKSDFDKFIKTVCDRPGATIEFGTFIPHKPGLMEAPFGDGRSKWCGELSNQISKGQLTGYWWIDGAENTGANSFSWESGEKPMGICARLPNTQNHCYIGHGFVQPNSNMNDELSDHRHIKFLQALRFAGLVKDSDVISEGYLGSGADLVVAPIERPQTTKQGNNGLTSIKGAARYIASMEIGSDRYFIAYAIQSFVESKLDPKFFLMEAEKKYGKPAAKLTPQDSDYSTVYIWKGDPIHLLMVRPAKNTQSGLAAQLETVYIPSTVAAKAIKDLAASKQKTKSDVKKTTIKSTQEGASGVEF